MSRTCTCPTSFIFPCTPSLRVQFAESACGWAGGSIQFGSVRSRHPLFQMSWSSVVRPQHECSVAVLYADRRWPSSPLYLSRSPMLIIELGEPRGCLQQDLLVSAASSWQPTCHVAVPELRSGDPTLSRNFTWQAQRERMTGTQPGSTRECCLRRSFDAHIVILACRRA